MNVSYDKRADILYIELLDGSADHSDERPWGLVDMNHDDEPVGVELWTASESMPQEVLGILGLADSESEAA